MLTQSNQGQAPSLTRHWLVAEFREISLLFICIREDQCFVVQAVCLLTKQIIQARMALSVTGNIQHCNCDRSRVSERLVEGKVFNITCLPYVLLVLLRFDLDNCCLCEENCYILWISRCRERPTSNGHF